MTNDAKFKHVSNSLLVMRKSSGTRWQTQETQSNNVVAHHMRCVTVGNCERRMKYGLVKS